MNRHKVPASFHSAAPCLPVPRFPFRQIRSVPISVPLHKTLRLANISSAVDVSYIALFGTAIQTGMVMVVYLDESLEKKRKALGTASMHTDLIAAIKEGARLRLRPKVMTVAIIVTSLLPIMWSTRTGVEVMKPLAALPSGGT